MTRGSEIKYPSSANLFQFCRLVLDHKFGGVRVIDQDVGQILGFDPADCSHWKKGKKNVRSIQAMRSIAEHLGVDERLVVEIASGELDEQEAYFEYLGYGVTDIDPKLLEAAKKEFYRKNASSWSRERELEFKNAIELDETLIDRVVSDIHKKINFQEAPLYLPEIAATYTDIQLKSQAPSPELRETPVSSQKTEKGIAIAYQEGSESRPYIRFKIASAMAPYFLAEHQSARTTIGEASKALTEAQNNLFAAKLLTPANLIRKEIQQVNISKDIVTQLADIFWVSKSFMNRRLKSILQSGSEHI